MIATGCVSPPLDAAIVRLDGTLTDVEVRGISTPHEGKTAILNLFVDVSDRKRADEALRRSESQLRALTSRLQSLREEERAGLAREIHDHLGQLLTALGLDLRLIERRLSGVDDEELRTSIQGKVASARSLTEETIVSVQKIASELRPAVLDRLGLEAAIEAEAEAFEARTGVRFRLSLPAQSCNAPPKQATALFRIFQEILTNVARHAKASNVDVQLSAGADEFVLTVKDDGVGIADVDLANPSSLGLLGMRERAQILGGHISFGRDRDKGTVVAVLIPLSGRSGKAA
jgi:signal transduction histidine kinase